MNSTFKSLLFWMVLVVVGVLIWNFSATFQTRDKAITFSEFVKMLDEGQVQKVTFTGNEILGHPEVRRQVPYVCTAPVPRASATSSSSAPWRCRQGADDQPVGRVSLRAGRPSC